MSKKMMVTIDDSTQAMIDRMKQAWNVKDKELVQSAVQRGLAEMSKSLTMQEERNAMDAEQQARADYTRRTGLPS